MARPKEKIVTIAEGAKHVGRKRSTVANWASQGYMPVVGQLPKTSPNGRPPYLYRLADIVRVAKKMPGPLLFRKPKPPAGYITSLEASGIMGCAGSTILRWFREGKIRGKTVPWGCKGKANFVYILKADAEAFAAKEQSKPVKYTERYGPRGGTEEVYVREQPKEDLTIERPLIYFQDSICLAARRARFEARGGKLSPVYTERAS